MEEEEEAANMLPASFPSPLNEETTDFVKEFT